jgi:hypothetical protein
MSNSILTISMITREALRVLSNNLTFTMNVNRGYDDQFGRHGAMIGQTVNIRKPAQYLGRRGPIVSIEAQNETYVPLVLNTQYGVDLSFTSAELSLSLDDFSERVIKPAIVHIANMIDGDGLLLLNQIYNQVGTPGTALTNNQVFLQAGVVLDQNLAPRDNLRSMVLDPATQAFAVFQGTTLFNPNNVISEQYKSGQMGNAYGFDWYMDQQAPTHTNGTYGGSPAVNGANQTGSSLITNGWTATTTSLNVGDIFTIAGVYRVNAQSKLPQTTLQQFVVTAQTVTDGSGNSTIAIAPAIITSGSLQNVSNSPGATAAITVVGASGVTTQLSVAFHRDAFVFGCAPLVVPPKGVVEAAIETDPQTGLAIRMIQSYDVRTDQFISRFDLLGGWATLYPQLAVRIATT